jgi:tryptophan synthase alpha subunit
MTHVVAGYPTTSKCIELLLAMQDAGVAAIEVQVPFSDPSADGSAIMYANDVALSNGITTRQTFAMLKKAREAGLKTPVYIMSYANKLLSFGIAKFCEEAAKCSVQGFIIPDLPYDTPEFSKLKTLSENNTIEIVPVISPGVSLERLKAYRVEKKQLVYVTSSKGITGRNLNISSKLKTVIEQIRTLSSCKIALGFGVRTPSNVLQALELADYAVVGSAVIEEIKSETLEHAAELINQLVHAQPGVNNQDMQYNGEQYD